MTASRKAKNKRNLTRPAPVTGGTDAGLRSWATQSVDRAEAALDRVEDTTLEAMRYVDHASTTFKRAVTELQLRAVQIGEHNTAAILDYWRKIIALTDASEIAAFHHGFVFRQFSAMVSQSVELSSLSLKLAASFPLPSADLKSAGLSE